MRCILVSILVIFCSTFLSINSIARNQQNSSSSGNATAIVICDIQGDPVVLQSQGSINTDSCVCNSKDLNDNWNNINCDESSDECSVCIADLLTSGFNIIQANSYYDSDDAAPRIKYTFTGSAYPLIDRIGGCPCT